MLIVTLPLISVVPAPVTLLAKFPPVKIKPSLTALLTSPPSPLALAVKEPEAILTASLIFLPSVNITLPV